MFHGFIPHVMGTRLDILMIHSNLPLLNMLWAHITDELERLDKMLNRFDATSEVSKLNSHTQQDSVSVSAELEDILRSVSYTHLDVYKRQGMGRLRYDIIRSSSQCFHLLSECFRFSQRSDLCRNMASFHSWVRQIHQNRFLSADYGIMRQCHLTFGIWSLCRPVQFAYRLLGTYSLLYLSGILCHQRA